MGHHNAQLDPLGISCVNFDDAPVNTGFQDVGEKLRRKQLTVCGVNVALPPTLLSVSSSSLFPLLFPSPFFLLFLLPSFAPLFLAPAFLFVPLFPLLLSSFLSFLNLLFFRSFTPSCFSSRLFARCILFPPLLLLNPSLHPHHHLLLLPLLLSRVGFVLLSPPLDPRASRGPVGPAGHHGR